MDSQAIVFLLVIRWDVITLVWMIFDIAGLNDLKGGNAYVLEFCQYATTLTPFALSRPFQFLKISLKLQYFP